jgi:hypothetical protein
MGVYLLEIAQMNYSYLFGELDKKMITASTEVGGWT